MIKYIKGFLKYFFNFRISKLALIDSLSNINNKAKIYRFNFICNSTVGAYTYVAPNSSLAHVQIGKYCSIASYVRIGLGKHNIKVISTSPIFQSKKNALKYKWLSEDLNFQEFETVTIGNDVWIGLNATILGGIKIADGAVIAANALVTKDVPPYAIVGGVPAKIIKFRFSEEVISRLLNLKWWDLDEKMIQNKISIFSQEDFYESLSEFE